jgi:hypothetical protein
MSEESRVVIFLILGGSVVFSDDRPSYIIPSLVAFLLSEESFLPYLLDLASKVG